MSELRRVLVTGVLGCIGSWVAKLLVEEGVEVVGFDLGDDASRLEMLGVATNPLLSLVKGDVSDFDALVAAAGDDEGVDGIIHVAALQIPASRRSPALSASVNVVGTVNVFELARKLGIGRVTYASSVAVHGSADPGQGVPVTSKTPAVPTEHYGVYKLANEGSARIFFYQDGISSIGLRPHTVYGPGRDVGVTSAHTVAIQHALEGKAYHIPYGGKSGFNFVEDTARAFVSAARSDHEGAVVLAMRGEVLSMDEYVAALHEVLGPPADHITSGTEPLELPWDIDDGEFERVLGTGSVLTPLEEGIARTVQFFRKVTSA